MDRGAHAQLRRRTADRQGGGGAGGRRGWRAAAARGAAGEGALAPLLLLFPRRCGARGATHFHLPAQPAGAALVRTFRRMLCWSMVLHRVHQARAAEAETRAADEDAAQRSAAAAREAHDEADAKRARAAAFAREESEYDTSLQQLDERRRRCVGIRTRIARACSAVRWSDTVREPRRRSAVCALCCMGPVACCMWSVACCM